MTALLAGIGSVHGSSGQRGFRQHHSCATLVLCTLQC